VAGQLAVARWQLRRLLARRASEAERLANECVISGGVDQVWARAEQHHRLDAHAEAHPLPAAHLAEQPPVRLNAFAL
jgi:hypothetical protein